jgi:hypothetical protein
MVDLAIPSTFSPNDLFYTHVATNVLLAAKPAARSVHAELYDPSLRQTNVRQDTGDYEVSDYATYFSGFLPLPSVQAYLAGGALATFLTADITGTVLMGALKSFFVNLFALLASDHDHH